MICWSRDCRKNKLFTLDNINLGFIRARNGAEWNLAYCQAELYAEFMLAEFGADALAKMLAAYADNLNTHDAIQRSFGIDQAEFDRRYSGICEKDCRRIAGRFRRRRRTDRRGDRQAAGEGSEECRPAGEVGARCGSIARTTPPRGSKPTRHLLEAPKNQLAAYVRARLHLLIGDTKPAIGSADGIA